MNWSLSDYLIAGTLLFSTGLVIVIVRQKVRGKNLRIAFIVGAVLACLYIWAELAVGLFTNWGS